MAITLDDNEENPSPSPNAGSQTNGNSKKGFAPSTKGVVQRRKEEQLVPDRAPGLSQGYQSD